MQRKLLTNDTSLDDIKDVGRYTVYHTSNISGNDFKGWNLVEVRYYANNANYAEQIVTNIDSGRIYKRVYYGGVWKGWVATATTSDLQNALTSATDDLVRITVDNTDGSTYYLIANSNGVKLSKKSGDIYTNIFNLTK